MKKNVSGQFIGCQLISKTDGSAVTAGTTTIYVCGDAGTQAAGSVGSGACTHEGNGYWSYAPAQAETNYDQIAFTFVNTTACNVTLQVFTTFPQTGDSFTRIGSAGAGLTALGDTRIANLDATVASRSTYAGGAVASVTGAVGSISGITFPTNFASLSITAAGLVDITQAAADKAWSTATRTLTSFGTLVADTWSYATRLLTGGELTQQQVRDSMKLAPTIGAPSAGSIDEHLDDILTDTAEVGVAGAGLTALGDTRLANLNTTVASRASQTSLDTLDDYVDTEVAAIKAKTDQLVFTIANQVDANALAVGDKTGYSLAASQTGVTIGTVNALGTQAKADVNAEVVDALTTDTYAEPSGVVAATSSIKDKLNWLFSLGRNKVTQTATTQTLRNDADTANIATSTQSDDATTHIRGEWT